MQVQIEQSGTPLGTLNFNMHSLKFKVALSLNYLLIWISGDGNATAPLPSVRSLETLHNALSLRQLDEFLERVVSTNYRPAASLTSSLQTISHFPSGNGDSASGTRSPGREPSPKLNGSMPGFSPSSSNSCNCFMEMKDGLLSLYREPILYHPQHHSQQHPQFKSTGLGYSGPPSYVSSAPSSPLFSSAGTEFTLPSRPVCSGQIVGSVTNLYQTPTPASAGHTDKNFIYGWEEM